MAADLSTLTEALDDADLDLAQTVRQLAGAAKRAVGSYVGLTIILTIGGCATNLTALEDLVQAADIRTSLRVPLEVADTKRNDTNRSGIHHCGTHRVDAAAGPSMELILYAGNPGALIDLAADLSWLTGRDPSDFVLDAHLIVAEHHDVLRATSWVNQAIGVLIGRGYTPEHAAREIDRLPTRTEHDRRRSFDHVLTGLLTPDPPST